METTWNKIWPVINILNEVCHGIHIINIEKEIGYSYDEIYNLLKKLKIYKTDEYHLDDKVEITLTEKEKKIIKSCFIKTLQEIDEWEFPIRIGITIEEGNKIISKLT